MIHQRLTTESWNENEFRVKDRVGDKIVYYQVNPLIDGDGFLRQELSIMELARQHGVQVPRVLTYSRAQEFEFCTMEYIEGSTLDQMDPPRALRARLIVDTYVNAMESVRRANTSNNRHPLVRQMRVPATSGDVYLHILTNIFFYARRYRLPLPPMTIHELANLFPGPEEPCVLVHGGIDRGRNIIVCADDTVKIINWQRAGFLPLNIARAISGTLDNSSTLGRLTIFLCDTADAGIFGDKQEFEMALGNFVRCIKYGW